MADGPPYDLPSAVHHLPYIPDPDRAYKNIGSFLTGNPRFSEKLQNNLEPIALLFSHSQFLANYCITHPDALFYALGNLDAPFKKEDMGRELRETLSSCTSLEEGMREVREFKKVNLLIITLKDILKKAEPQEIMFAMSGLADAIASESLSFVESRLSERFGRPEHNAFVVLALGKLGAEELNYSSDIDIIFVYREEGETSGISMVPGVTMNRISSFEYCTKIAEEFTRFLSSNTADGFAYRVDLRLRPQGQRGNLVLTLRGYEEYYESWGQLWERAALLRTRPIAGDMALGNDFLHVIKPFVYRKYLDFDAIDEIRRMKAQVEQLKGGTLGSDIKRGYGGIREIEFFIQIFQLIYGGKEPLLRERSTLKSLHRLLQKGLIGYDDVYHLSENYLFLRTLEHRLQQLNDIQTHTLPGGGGELDVLGRKMGFSDRGPFLSELNARRRKTRGIYDSLLQSREQPPVKDVQADPSQSVLDSIFWDTGSPIEPLLTEELSKTGVGDVRRGIHCLRKIRNTIYSFQTIRGRRLLEDVIPRFVKEALKGSDPDLAILQLVDFSALLATRESYLEAISQRQEIISSLTFVFSHSEYLTKILMSSPYYIESLVEEEIRKKRKSLLRGELKALMERYGDAAAVRLFRRLKELRVGILFLNQSLSARDLLKSLTKVADTVLSSLLVETPSLTVIGLGKLGGREIIFNSDLDIIFLTRDEPETGEIKGAERLLKVATLYTKEGIAYRIDTRLRPEGNKGPLVNSLQGLRDYYLKSAKPWELQALTKARPVNAERVLGKAFMDMREEVLTKRGVEVTLSEVRRMRERIQRELSKEAPTAGIYDIKLGPGGLEDLEFSVQYLQLRHCAKEPRLLVQGTIEATKRLNRAGYLGDGEAQRLSEIYTFYRTIETVLRLRNESVLKRGTDVLQSLAHFLDMEMERLPSTLEEKRGWMKEFWDRLE